MFLFKRKTKDKKYYTLKGFINGGTKRYQSYPIEKFSKRSDAIQQMTKYLEREEKDVDYVIKRNRNHSCEYVCTDGISRFFIDRVKIEK